MNKIIYKIIKVLLSILLIGHIFLEFEIFQMRANENSDLEIEIHMLDVGQGLCVLIKDKQNCIVYDGGGREKSSYVVSYLKKNNVEKIDYIIASHYDEDHIAGLIGIMSKNKVQTLLCPDYSVDTNVYSSFVEKAKSKNITTIHPNKMDRFEAGDIKLEILSANKNIEEENDYSIVTRITFQNKSILLMGDASSRIEKEFISSKIDLKTDILVLGHHGSSTSNSEEFINKVNPKIILLSCGKGNQYGHPSEDVMKRVEKADALFYRTDLQNEVVIRSSDNDYTCSKESCKDWSSGEKVLMTEDYTENIDEMEYKYILNNNTKKIHNSDCVHVKKISAYNKEYSNESIKVLEELGYTRCYECTKKD